MLFVICLWVLGFDSFKEWTDDKLKKFCIYCQGMGLISKSQVPSLGWKNVSLNAFWLLELPNQNRRKILFLQTTWQSKVIINLISFQKVALWENCIEYILYMEDFWLLQLNQMLEMERLSTKRVVAHPWWQLLHHEKFTNYCKSDLTKYIFLVIKYEEQKWIDGWSGVFTCI